MRSRLAVALLATTLALSGCGGPYAADVDAPSGRAGDTVDAPAARTTTAELRGTMRVSSLPAEATSAVGDEPVNCFYVGPELDEDLETLPTVDAVEVTLRWTPEVPALDSTLAVHLYTTRADATTVGGPSPLGAKVTGAMLPLAIRVEPNGPVPAALLQSVDFHVKADGYTGSFIVWPIGCLE